MIKAVVIDFDDTLCPTEECGFALENEALRRIGRPPQSREVHKSTWGRELLEAIAVRSPGVDVAAFRTAVFNLIPEWVAAGKFDVIPADHLEALARLRRNGYDVYVLTSRARDELGHLLAPEHDLATHIKAFYYREVVSHPKPDPRAFETLLNAHSLQRRECVYVGDSVSDAMAAAGAGMFFIANLESGLRAAEDFAAWQIDAFVNCFAAVPEAIMKLPAARRPARLPVRPLIRKQVLA